MQKTEKRDTALKKKGSDYTVMMVIAFGSDGRIYVIDFIRDKMKLSEKRDKILDLIERWRPSIVFWEENASVEGGEHIREEIEKRGWAGLEFYAFRQPTTISKEDRIGKLEPDFRAGKILFMYERWYRMYDMHRSEAEGTSPKATRRARKRVRMDRDLVQDFFNDEYLMMTRMRRRTRGGIPRRVRRVAAQTVGRAHERQRREVGASRRAGAISK